MRKMLYLCIEFRNNHPLTMKQLLSIILGTVLLMPMAKAQEDLQKGGDPWGTKKSLNMSMRSTLVTLSL